MFNSFMIRRRPTTHCRCATCHALICRSILHTLMSPTGGDHLFLNLTTITNQSFIPFSTPIIISITVIISPEYAVKPSMRSGCFPSRSGNLKEKIIIQNTNTLLSYRKYYLNKLCIPRHFKKA